MLRIAFVLIVSVSLWVFVMADFGAITRRNDFKPIIRSVSEPEPSRASFWILPENPSFFTAFQGSIFYIENHITPPPPFPLSG